MIFKFNTAQLGRVQHDSLANILNALQSENENELVVTPVEFPNKFLVMLDDNIGMLLRWDVEKQSYAGMTEPESPNKPEAGAIKPFELPESQKDTVDLPKQEPEGELIAALDMAGNVVAGPELVNSEIGPRVEALARALVKLTKPLDNFQRGEVWIQFCEIFIKELLG